MNEEIKIVANEMWVELDQLINEAKFDESVFSECGASAYESFLAANMLESDSKREGLLEESQKKFAKLYESTPIPSKKAVYMISLAYGLLWGVVSTPAENQDSLSSMRALVHISLLIGKAMPMLKMASFVNIFKDDYERENREQKRRAQKLAAEARRRPYQLLENWALEKAKEMKEDDMELSFLLAAQIPADIKQYC